MDSVDFPWEKYVGKYTSHMDPMGKAFTLYTKIDLFDVESRWNRWRFSDT